MSELLILKPHYRAVILVLASNENNITKNARKVWKKYMEIDPTIKVYFVYGKLFEELEDYDITSDLVFNEVEENYPVYIEKTIKAMEYIDSHIKYDFFIRTNLSTFWDFEKLHLHLNDLPKERCYSGDGPLPGYNSDGFYLSGTDTIVTPEMITSIINNKHIVDYNIVEDAAMGLYFNRHMGVPMLPNRICFFEDFISIEPKSQIIGQMIERIYNAKKNNCDHYRVKTLNGPREQMDMYIYILLLKSIYNIQY